MDGEIRRLVFDSVTGDSKVRTLNGIIIMKAKNNNLINIDREKVFTYLI